MATDATDRSGEERLVLSHFCLRHASFEERVSAAAAAGLSEIGFLYRAYDELRSEGVEPGALLEVLARYGVRVTELEVLRPWSNDENGLARSAKTESTLFEMAEVFGARYLQVIGPYAGDLNDAAATLARLCDRAGEVGLVVGIEFLPFTNIPDARGALELIDRTGSDNLGVCIDAWHHVRGAHDWSLLEALPPERIVAVQLDDGPIKPENPDYLSDCLANRRVLGAGSFDLARLISLLRSKDITIPLSLEVISDELDRLEPTEAVRRIVDSARTLLASVPR